MQLATGEVHLYMATTTVSKPKRVIRRKVTRRKYIPKRDMALLLPAHNEELIIEQTILSAIKAGQRVGDIYVVDDNSSDKTRKMALKHLPRKNVLTVERSGKAGAVIKAIKHFNIESLYVWIHIADADSVFCKDYFRLYRKKLNARQYAAAVGFVQSLRGNWISKYRTYSYTYGQEIIRRLQDWLGVISVFPGPVTAFRTNIIKHLDFENQSLTEDLDLTLQFHRKKLGKIVFIPEAINYTQDPQNLRDFIRQTLRWHRGFFQGISKHKLGRRFQGIDAWIVYQLIDAALYIARWLFLVPYVVYITGSWIVIPLLFMMDIAIISIVCLFVAASTRRPIILTVIPAFYVLSTLELVLFFWAFIEIIILRKFRSTMVGWETEGRRYSLDANALKDTAK